MTLVLHVFHVLPAETVRPLALIVFPCRKHVALPAHFVFFPFFLPVEHPNHFRCPPFYYTVRCWNVVVVPLYTILSFYFICTGQVNDAFHPSAVTGCTCSSVSVGQPLVKRSTNFFSFLFPASVRQSIDPFRAVFLFLQMKIPPMLRREIVLRPCSRSK